MRTRLNPHHAGGMAFHRTPLEALLEKLSGWQRKQWMRAGQPMDEASLRQFAQLQRGQAQASGGGVVQGALCTGLVPKGNGADE